MQKKLLLIMTFLFAVSCSMHKFINKDINPQGTMAIIVGETQYEVVNDLFANKFSNQFEAGSKMNVLPQHKVKSKLGDYPKKIRGPYTLLGDEVDLDYSKHDLDSLSKIAKKLNVNYLYVFWIPRSAEHTMTVTNPQGFTRIVNVTVEYSYVGELIEFPSRRIIAQADFSMFYIKEGATNGPRTIQEMCDYYSLPAANEIIQKTGISK